MRLPLDIIIFKRDSFDSENLYNDVSKYSDNFKFIRFNNYEVKGYFKFFRLPGKLYYWFYPLAFIYDNLMIFGLFLFLCIKYKVSVIHMETYSTCWVGLLRRLGLCKKLIYVVTDWFVIDEYKGFWNRIGWKIFKFFDWLAWLNSDLVLNLSQYQIMGRSKFSEKEILYKPRLELKSIPKSPRYEPVFIGEIRPDSINNLVPKLKVVRYKDRKDLPELLSESLCGVNLIKNLSCTNYTISSKIMDYLQHGLPILVTLDVGEIVFDIVKHNIGYVVAPYKESIEHGLKKCYINQRELTENVVKYITEREFTNLYDVWKT